MAIYLKVPEGKEFKSVYDLLYFGFTNHPPRPNHWDGGPSRYQDYKFVKTYNDIDCCSVQCDSARRSIEDMLEIAQTYFPKTTLKVLIRTLVKLNSTIGLYPRWCCTITKLVFQLEFCLEKKDLPKNNLEHYFLQKSTMCEKDKRGKGLYSYNDFIKLTKKYKLIRKPKRK